MFQYAVMALANGLSSHLLQSLSPGLLGSHPAPLTSPWKISSPIISVVFTCVALPANDNDKYHRTALSGGKMTKWS